ncbi:MAG TPA: tRNA uridine-5-carboxymethylaminomethyl(34) synthesis GTPase MnmE [Mycobacteriales bacterium]|nr:tRNA uridine-5-carboxymethylaminomethyl(34) synthesis GTPase MnmE [Mycobacteriales bacterium]
MLETDDTIVAIATPPGQGGVGIVRLSGGLARSMANRIFTPARAGTKLGGRRLIHGELQDPVSGIILDDCLCCLMPAPHSYTGEDVVEFHCHGSPVVLREVTSCCLGLGARLAGRGEFTLRAFLNGRLDLAQVEAVMGLVGARTATAAQVAARGVQGALAHRLAPLQDTLTGTLAYLEATIDFTEEDLPELAGPELADAVARSRIDLEGVLRRAGHGALLRDGVRVVLAGKPNVGKSSLLNALLRRDRAIVTPVPGTTRDTLEEAVDIHGLPMFLVDTAGLAPTDDPIERLGIERSTEALRHAGIIALVMDIGAAPDAEDRAAAIAATRRTSDIPVLLVLNKCDLSSRLPADRFLALLDEEAPASMPQSVSAVGYGAARNNRPIAEEAACARQAPDMDQPRPFQFRRVVECAAAGGLGLNELEDALADLALAGETLNVEDTLIDNARQRQALEAAIAALVTAEAGLRAAGPAEITCIDLRSALESLAEITGRNVDEAVLDRIFRDFCIGK